MSRFFTRPAERAALIGIFALTLLTALLRTLHIGGTDDAFITFVFARNLAAGHGIAWIPGEGPVWGSSTLLFTLLLAALGKLGASIPVAATVAGAIAWGAANLLLARAVAALTRPWVGLAAGGFAALTIQQVEMSMGMETGLYVCLALSACRLYADDRPAAASVVAWLAYLARTDGVIVLALLLGHALLAALAERRIDWRLLARLAGPCLALMALTGIATALYFGGLVPNSAQAKASFGPEVSGRFSIQFFLSIFLPLGNRFLPPGTAPFYQGAILLAWAAGLAWTAWRFRDRDGTALVFGPANLALYHVAAMPNSLWYYGPTMQGAFGLLLVGLFAIAAGLRRVPRAGAALAWLPVAVGLVAAALFSLNTVNTVRRDPWGRSFNDAATTHPFNDLRVITDQVERRIREHGETAPDILAYEVGLLGWFAGGKVRDVLGLVSPEVLAAAPADRPLLLLERYRPRYAALVDSPTYPPTAPIIQSRAFLAAYRPVYAKPRSFGDNYLLFQRTDRVASVLRELPLRIRPGEQARIPVDPGTLLCLELTAVATVPVRIDAATLLAVPGGPREACLTVPQQASGHEMTVSLPPVAGTLATAARIYLIAPRS